MSNIVEHCRSKNKGLILLYLTTIVTMIDNDFMKYMWDLYLTTIVTMIDNNIKYKCVQWIILLPLLLTIAKHCRSKKQEA